MAEELLNGEFRLFVGEQEIATHPQEGISLDYAIPIQEPLMAFDPAQEGGDKTGITAWHNGSIEFTLTIDNEDNPVGKWFWNMVRRFRRERKALLWALTHGYTLRIPCRDEGESEGYFDLTLPSQLRKVMRITKFIPQYRIYDRYGCRYVVRKGRVVRMKSFPIPKEDLEMYYEKLKQYKV